MTPARVWNPVAVLLLPPIRPGIVAEFPARLVKIPSPYSFLRASAVDDLPTLDSPTIRVSRYPRTPLKCPRLNCRAV